MATQALTKTPTAIAGLTLDTIYTVQCQSPGRVFFQTATSAPSDSSGAFSIGGGEFLTIKRTGSNQIYAWQPEGVGLGFGKLVYGEAP